MDNLRNTNGIRSNENVKDLCEEIIRNTHFFFYREPLGTRKVCNGGGVT